MIRSRIAGPEEENGAPPEEQFYVPSNEASGKPRFLRIACNVLRFPVKAVYNKTPFSTQSYADPVARAPETPK